MGIVSGFLVALFTAGAMVLVSEHLSGHTKPETDVGPQTRRTAAATISATVSLAFLTSILTSRSLEIAVLSSVVTLSGWALL